MTWIPRVLVQSVVAKTSLIQKMTIEYDTCSEASSVDEEDSEPMKAENDILMSGLQSRT